MGSRESEALAGKKKAGSSKREKKAKEVAKVNGMLDQILPDLSEFIDDAFNPMLELRIKIREDGSFLGIAKRENDVIEEVIFSVQETVVEVLLNLNQRLEKGVWKESIPWVPDK